MPVRKHRAVKLLYVLAVLVPMFMTRSAASAHQPRAETTDKNRKQYLPVVFVLPAAAEPPEYDLINQLRANAGVAPVRYNPTLERNCFEHARYMAENRILTHEQNPNRPYASSNGQTCARQANVWLASGTPVADWTSDDAVKNWMTSVSHRIWLLYPTSKEFGLGFYSSQATNHAGAAVDVLSGADFAADEDYRGWPVRYPGNGEKAIPASRYPITLNWRYFGPEPVLSKVRLTMGNGTVIAHEATTQMSIGHKGIQITPTIDLPKQSKIIVSVSGRYDGVPFSYSWHFYTGTKRYSSSAEETRLINNHQMPPAN